MQPPDPTLPEPSHEGRSAFLRILLAVVLLGAGLALLGLLGLRAFRSLAPSLTEAEVRETAWAALQRESRQSFLLTGRLDVMATAEVEDTRTVLPGWLDLSLGTTRATVRVPGSVHYGVDLSGLGPEMIRLLDDGVVEVSLPDVEVRAVEPDLSRMEVRTDRGWARRPATGRVVEHRAIQLVENVLRRQGTAHLEDSTQPRINTARAAARLLSGVLVASGMESPRFRILVGKTAVSVGPDAG